MAGTTSQDYYAIIKNESALIACEKNTTGSTPKELFEDMVEDAEAQFDKDKRVIKEAIKAAGLAVDSTTTFDDFCKAISADTLDASLLEEVLAVSPANK